MVAAEIGLVSENKGVLQKLLQLNVCSRVDKTEYTPFEIKDLAAIYTSPGNLSCAVP